MATLKNTVINDVGAITLPKGTTAQRPTNPPEGALRYNTDLGYTECYWKGYWFDVATGADKPVMRNLVAHFDSNHPDSNTGTGNTWYDISSNNNNASLVGITRTTSTPGNVLQTAGNNSSYIEMDSNTNAAFNLTNPLEGYTVIVCQRYSGGTRGRMLCARRNNWLLGHHSSGCTNHYAEGWIYGSNGGGQVVNDELWRVHAATGKVDADFYEFWIDGQRVAGPQDTAGASGPNGFLVGIYQSMTSEHSTGQISEILIYNRAMTPDEMKQSTLAVMKKNGVPATYTYTQG
jgi:hypothetical protein|tara:strand:+ start:1921 stop:2790 length:870 start_codon:yes stop_codon:yes gene_type:complete